jgi:Dual specificity phosphatase, catalytic domain
MKGVLDGSDGKPVLFVGSDDDDPEAQKKGYYILSACKDGPYGHRAALKYTTLGAPKGPTYYSAKSGKRMVLNLIDHESADFIPEEAVFPGLRFINDALKAGHKVLVHCNHGHSRSATIAMMFLCSIGELSDNFRTSEKVFKSLYPPYDPTEGMQTFARRHWRQLKDNFYGQSQ